MKLIIDIPEYEYKCIKEIYEKSDIVEATYSYIVHGIPLEDIKAEISQQEIKYRKQNDRCGVGLDKALRIIEKYIGDKT